MGIGGIGWDKRGEVGLARWGGIRVCLTWYCPCKLIALEFEILQVDEVSAKAGGVGGGQGSSLVKSGW